jgi:cytochrome P450
LNQAHQLVRQITSFAEARAALAHPDLTRDPSLRGTTEPMERHVLNATGNDHARQRRVVAEMIERRTTLILPRLCDLVESLLDQVPTGSVVDMAVGFAHPVALGVVDDLLDLTGGDQRALQWWRRVALEVDRGRLSQALLRTVREQARTRTGPLIAAMVATGLELDPEEQAANVFFAFLAGFTNVANITGNALLALARHPDQYAWLATEPATRVPDATEELLRYAEPAGRSSMRVAAAPLELGRVRIAAGEKVLICRGEANRDPSRYLDPDRLDLTRAARGQLTLGFGPHYCPASALARHLLDSMLFGLVRRFASLRSDLTAWDVQGGAPLPIVMIGR